MKPEDLLRWFRQDLLPTLIRKGFFSNVEDSQTLEKCEFEAIERAVSSFASVPSFAKLTLNTPNGIVTRDIIIKFQSQDPIFRQKMKLTRQFQNEVTMYTKILPSFADFLTRSGKSTTLITDIVPECYYAVHSNDDPERSVVIMKDLRKDGYRLSESVTELDLQHCLLAFERIAQFHAISFAMKIKNSKTFDELKDSFVHVWFEDDEFTRKQCEDFVGCVATRGIDYLLSHKSYSVPSDYLENFRKMLTPSSLFDFLRGLKSPSEPLSVICHGDFNRNNILYRYDSAEPIDAKLFDFQTFFYGSPCLDLCFFLYMNTTFEFREKHFEDILSHYHSTLIKRISLILEEAEEGVAGRLPLGAFRKDFGRVAITAYVTVAFFLPVMMTPAETNFEEDMKEKSFGELALENRAKGGDVVSKRVAEVIVDFYRRAFYV